MSARNGLRTVFAALLGLTILMGPGASLSSTARAEAALPDPAFTQVWGHCDLPVRDGVVQRSWMWGPEAFSTSYEPYAQGPGGLHLVTYFDKSRMEINNPAADRNSQWFVTNGLLVIDMMTGRVQTGDAQFESKIPANIPVAGDTATSLDAPTYATLARVASLNGDMRAPNRTGQVIREGLGRDANLGILDNLAGLATYAAFEPTTGHNIADVFWAFMNQRGTTYHDGQLVPNDLVVDWVFAMGYPVTEPYWIQIKVAGADRWVLMQAFQRRILTFAPYNPEGWKVEMANVGRAYYDWRFGPAPAPTPEPQPKPAYISLSPASGDTNTTITVSGKNFPPGTAVALAAENSGANFYNRLSTITTKGDGSFKTRVTLPVSAARLGEVYISATAANGKARAIALFDINFGPSVMLTQREIVAGGQLRVMGEGFPANASIKLGILWSDNKIEWPAGTRSDGSGSFTEVIFPGSGRPPGLTFRVVALADNGIKATSEAAVTLIATPRVQVLPESGPVGAYVTFRGHSWPPNRVLTIGTRPGDGFVEALWPAPLTTDSAGNFAAQMLIPAEYARKSAVMLFAFDSVSAFRAEAVYTVTGPAPTPTPRAATVGVTPNVLAVGQPALVSGANWPAGWVVQIGVGRPGHGVEEWVATARASGARTFATTMVLGSRWQNAGQLLVTAFIPNLKIAVAFITVTGPERRITPSGLPMTVSTWTGANGQTSVKLTGKQWRAGSAVHAYVISADGALNVEKAAGTVNSEGTFSTSFYLDEAWAVRTDLGVRATTPDGQSYSLRYLPLSAAKKVAGTSSTYEVKGFNWPAGAEIDVLVQAGGDGSGAGERVSTLVTDANGSFRVTLDLPRLPSRVKSDLELRAKSQPYSASFDL